jgi:hypothetical protein
MGVAAITTGEWTAIKPATITDTPLQKDSMPELNLRYFTFNERIKRLVKRLRTVGFFMGRDMSGLFKPSAWVGRKALCDK